MHPREAIRNYAVSLVTSAATLAGANVFNARFYPSDAPIHVRVYTTEDNFVDYNDLGQRSIDRALLLVFECVVHHETTPESKLDDLCRQIELAINADFLFGTGSSKLLLLNQYESTVIEPSETDAKKKTFLGRITYRATYPDAWAA